MNHDEATRFFDQLGETAESRPPTADLIATGRTAERRKRRRTIGASVAAVALILGGGAVAQVITHGSSDDGDMKPSGVGEVLPAPDGMRFVAMNRVAVAVPDTWGIQDTRCGQPVGPTVYFTESFTRACLVAPKKPIPTLHFVDSDSDEGRLFASGVDDYVSTRNGMDVFEGESCPDTASCVEALPYVVDIPSEGVLIVLQGPARNAPLRDQILDTLSLLPDGLVAVPRIEPGAMVSKANDQLEAAGLTPRADTPDVDLPTFGTDPAAASVVAAGSVVSLVLEPQSSTPTDQPFEAGRRIVDRYIAEHPREDVTSATVLAKAGTVRQPNTGEKCESGQLLRIDLFGSFPDIATGGVPGGDGTDGVVRKVMLTADAESEEVCLVGVHTGAASPNPEATLIFGPDQAEEGAESEGLRLVGSDRVVVAVPGSWVESDGCGPTDGALLNMSEPGTLDDGSCGDDPSLAIVDADSELGRGLTDYALEDETIAGVDVQVGDACLPTAACIYAGKVVVITGQQIVLIVSQGSSSDAALVDRIIGSLRLRPDLGDPDITGIANDTLRVGETAELELYLHCGLEWARIDDSDWETTPRGNGSTPVHVDTLVGEATRVSEDRVEFVSPAFGKPVVFRPVPPDPTRVCF